MFTKLRILLMKAEIYVREFPSDDFEPVVGIVILTALACVAFAVAVVGISL